MKQKYSKRDIAKMQRIYKQTMSMTATAAACGCSRGTIKKYRDEQKWVTPKQIKALANKYKNDTTLTTDIANRLYSGWLIHMQDIDLCAITGITWGQLHGWLTRNIEATVIFTVEVEVDGKKEKQHTMVTAGLRTLRERAWANFEYQGLQKLEQIEKLAIANKDYKTAAAVVEWKLEKRLPKKFGAQATTTVTTQVQINQISIDELPMETRKQILAQIRAKKEITKEIDNG